MQIFFSRLNMKLSKITRSPRLVYLSFHESNYLVTRLTKGSHIASRHDFVSPRKSFYLKGRDSSLQWIKSPTLAKNYQVHINPYKTTFWKINLEVQSKLKPLRIAFLG